MRTKASRKASRTGEIAEKRRVVLITKRLLSVASILLVLQRLIPLMETAVSLKLGRVERVSYQTTANLVPHFSVLRVAIIKKPPIFNELSACRLPLKANSL